MENVKTNSYKSKLQFKIRKFLISLKRNYYVVPLIITLISAFYFLCVLYILSPNFARVSASLVSYGGFTSIFFFLVTLFDILYCIAYLNFALKKYGAKRPVYMLIVYYVLMILSVVLLILLINVNLLNINEEIESYTNAVSEADKKTYYEYIVLGQKSNVCMIVSLVLSGISLVAVSTAPFIQTQFKKLKFAKIEENPQDEQKEESKQ